MKAYIAGKLGTEEEKETLYKIDELCKSLDIKTFMPHRDVGICKNMEDVDKTFRGDILHGFKDCSVVIACLDGLHVGAGTAWELGYAYAKNIPAIGLKMDEPVHDALDYLSPILIASMPIVNSFDKLREFLIKINQES